MSSVRIQNLKKEYGQVHALDGLNLEVSPGTVFGFLGPNGAGKTTTVRILTGVIKAEEGSALILGYKSGSLNAKQIAGVVPEMANAYNDLPGWRNLMLMAELYGVTGREAKERGEELLQGIGLFERKDDLVQGYSKGMKQRLILCMALISDPQVLFLDEPTSGLDVQSARLINELLRSLNAKGKTIFLTTHDMDEANQLCNRVAIISQGKLVAIDAPEKLKMATSGLHSVEVSFDEIAEFESLVKLPGVSTVKKIGDKFKLYTADPGQLVTILANYSSSNGLKIISLSTLSPSLEDAFVALVGKETK